MQNNASLRIRIDNIRTAVQASDRVDAGVHVSAFASLEITRY